MAEKINIADFLKRLIPGGKFYSITYGPVEYRGFEDGRLRFEFLASDGIGQFFTTDIYGAVGVDGECIVFPSKDDRDWRKYINQVQVRFNPEKFKPFDKVLVRDSCRETWELNFFSRLLPKDTEEYNDGYRVRCFDDIYTECIPYNNDTKIFLGRTEDCQVYFRWWLNY